MESFTDAILNDNINRQNNFYDILGCDKSSTFEQINAEYKIKAVQYHPDKNAEQEATEKFKRLQNAKQVLTDPSLRNQYDKWLNCGLPVTFEDWMNKKLFTSLHWICVDQGQGTMLTDGKNDPEEKSTNTARNDIIKMFRNYEI